MVWLSDPALSAADDYIAQKQFLPPAAPEPSWSDWGAYDAGMLDAFSRPYIYEDGSFSDGSGSVYDIGMLNPWEPGWQVPPGYRSANGIDRRGADPYAGGGGLFTGDPLYSDTSGNYWDSAAQAWRDPASGLLWDADRGWYDSAVAPDVAMPRGWWDGSDPGMDAAVMGGLQSGFDQAQDLAYFEGPSDDMRLGDWVWRYADFGPEQDRAYFQATLPPENPQDAAQRFLYDPPKIDPANIQWGTSNWLSTARDLLAPAASFVNDYTLEPLGIDAGELWPQADRYIFQPLDYVAELGADVTPIVADSLLGPAADFYRGIERMEDRWDIPLINPPDLPESNTARESVIRDLQDYQGTVENFRSRPFAEQLIAGTIYDPTMVLPGIGYGDDIVEGLRGFRSGVDDVIDRARPYADDVLRNLGDELGAIQVGRTSSLRIGDVVRDAGGQEWRVAKNFDGNINGWVSLVDESAENGIKRVKRGMLDNTPIESVADEAAAIAPTPRPGEAGGVPPGLPPTDMGPMDLDSARDKLMDALRREANIRRVGTADREIAAGRAAQVAGIRDRLAEGRAMGLQGSELAEYARGGMRTGPLRKTVAPALDLAPAEREALVQGLIDSWSGGSFDLMTATKAVQKMFNGEGLQPRELKMLRDAFGDEVADVVATRPKVSPLMEARKEATEMARNNAIAERQYRKAADEAERLQQQATRLAAAAQETSDRAMYREKWKAIARQNDADEIRTMLANPFMTPEERAAALKAVTAETDRAQRAAGRTVEQIWESAKRANPDAEDLRRKAISIIRKKVENPKLANEAERSVALWLDSNRAVLDAIGETTRQRWRQLEASLSGNVSDSFTSALLRREDDLRAALRAGGIDDDIAKKVARVLRDRELTMRYRGKIPPAVSRALEEAKSLSYGASQGLAPTLGNASQYLKNSMFWADFAVAGQQVMKAIITSGPQFLAGMANRAAAAMNLPHLVTNLAEAEGISKHVAYQIDGVMQGTRTGAVDLDRSGSIFSKVPGVSRFADWLTEQQFGSVLTGVRNAIYEGNLMAAKLGGQDITDPKVRAAAANWANIATSAGGRAQDVRRAEWERALLLSPQFTRAQVKQIVKLADLVRPSASMTDRLLAATTIASTAAIGLGAGKFINDRYGIGGFEMDPSKPGFGRITFPGGRVVDIFPQDQLITAIARSIRELSSLDEEGLRDASDTWTKFALGRISPPLQMAAKSAGYGFDPRSGGWKLGDYQGDIVSNLPIPPGFIQVWREGLDPIGTPLSFMGVTNYQESPSMALDRLGYWDMTTDERKVARETQPDIAKAYHEYTQEKSAEAHRNVSEQDLRTLDFERRAKEMNRIEGERTVNQQVAWQQYQDQLAAAPPEQRMALAAQFRDTVAAIQNNAAMEKRGVDNAFRLFQDSGELPTDANDRAKVEYYALFDVPGMKGPDGKLNGEAFAKAYEDLAKGWTAAQRSFVESEVRGQKYNIPEVQQMYADQRTIAESGYFDLEENKRAWRQEHPEIADLIRKWGYSPTSILAEDVTNEYATQQAADDANLRTAANPGGTLSPMEWRQNYRSRMDQLSAAKDIIYRGLAADGEATTAIDRWFAQIDAAEQPNGKVDWDQVDAWLAQQPAEMQAEIDAYTGTALTPQVAEYRQEMKAAGSFFELRDQTWAELQSRVPQLQEYGSQQELMQEVTNRAAQRLAEQGVPWAVAMDRGAEIAGNLKMFDTFNKIYKEGWLYPWIAEHPEEALFLVEYGYYSPDASVKKALTRWALEQGGQ